VGVSSPPPCSPWVCLGDIPISPPFFVFAPNGPPASTYAPLEYLDTLNVLIPNKCTYHRSCVTICIEWHYWHDVSPMCCSFGMSRYASMSYSLRASTLMKTTWQPWSLQQNVYPGMPTPWMPHATTHPLPTSVGSKALSFALSDTLLLFSWNLLAFNELLLWAMLSVVPHPMVLIAMLVHCLSLVPWHPSLRIVHLAMLSSLLSPIKHYPSLKQKRPSPQWQFLSLDSDVPLL